MSEQQRQQLSALVDGEIDSPLVHTTLSALESSSGLKQAWEHYHIIGAAIRSEPIEGGFRRIAAGVQARIADEPDLPKRAPWYRGRTPRVGSFGTAALAAAVAFFAVFAAPQLFAPGRPEAGPPPQRVAGLTPPPAQFRLPGPTQRWHVDEPALESKLDQFLVNHQEQSPVSGMKGFLPYATVVGYEAR